MPKTEISVWERLEDGEFLDLEQKKEVCNGLMTTEPRMEALILKFFTEKDFKKVLRNRIGGGLIGGKACGLLMARKIIERKLPEYMDMLLPHHSWFIGSEMFCRYLEENDCVELLERQIKEQDEFTQEEELYERLRSGTISCEMENDLKKLLASCGQEPIVVRSSSFLEDGFGNTFSGKYESVFCMNQGSEEERLEELKDAVRRVYASTQNKEAIEYRRTRNIMDTREQMALLVQRVEGRFLGEYYLPLAAGMGCSYNPYKWMEQMNPDAGMLRIVTGLGTRAVERTPGDYPRLVGLDRAKGNIYTSVAERHKFSQRQVDVLYPAKGRRVSIWLEQLIPLLSRREKKLVLSHDTDAEARLAEMRQYRDVYFADCQGIAYENEFIRMMSQILKTLEREYGRPVDIEFALECEEDGELRINLYQCRPQQHDASEEVKIPKGVDHEILFDVRRTSMRRSKEVALDVIVRVDPQKYYEYPYSKKPDVSRMIGRINKRFGKEGKKMLLLVPGRIGTSSPELGIPVTYSDVSRFSAICEVAYSKAGYNPALSYGSHMFQDLVEADVYYGAINENSKTRLYQPELLEQFPEIFAQNYPEAEELYGMIMVYDLSEDLARLILDSREGRAVCQVKKEKMNK